MANRKLIVEVVGDSSSLERSFARSTSASKKFGADMGRTSDQVSASFARMGKLFAGGLLAGGAVAGLRDSVNEASDLNEQITKAQAIFKDAAGATIAWSKTTANAFGISQRAALEAAGTFGNLIETVGLGPDKAADMSKALVKLAADLASFNNANPQDTLDALRSGLIGEAEPLRKYGVLLSEARVQQEAMAETGKTTAKSLTDAEKAIARYNLILKDSAPAQGDFARTADGAANAGRRLSANIDNLKANLGSGLVPALARATGGMADFTAAMQTASITADQLVNNKALRDKFADAFGIDELFKQLNAITSAGLLTRPDEGSSRTTGPAKAARVKFALDAILGPIEEATKLAQAELAKAIKQGQDAVNKAASPARTKDTSMKAVTAISDAEKAARAAAAEQARQFRTLGLDKFGNKPPPTIANLSKQLEQLTSHGGLSAKAQGQLARIGKLLTDPINKATEESRKAILDMFDTIRGTFADEASKGFHTPTTALNRNKILKGLVLDRDTQKILEQRLSGFNSAGLALAGRPPLPTGNFVGNAPSGPAQPVVINMQVDGRTVATAAFPDMLKQFQKRARSNPRQRRGHNAGRDI